MDIDNSFALLLNINYNILLSHSQYITKENITYLQFFILAQKKPPV